MSIPDSHLSQLWDSIIEKEKDRYWTTFGNFIQIVIYTLTLWLLMISRTDIIRFMKICGICMPKYLTCNRPS